MSIVSLIQCPECFSTNIGTVGHVTTVSYIEGLDENNQIIYTGETDYHNGHLVIETDDDNHPAVRCAECGYEWIVPELTV